MARSIADDVPMSINTAGNTKNNLEIVHKDITKIISVLENLVEVSV